MTEWKDIPGYEGLYQASNDGQIRTCEGKVTHSKRFEHRVWKQRVLKQKRELRKNGKYTDGRVNLWKDGSNKTLLVSRLVAMTWCDGYREWLTVNHIDGNPENNCCENLEWVDLAENIRHGFDNGLYSSSEMTTIVFSDGTEKHFRSKAEASRYLGKCNGYISNVQHKMGKRESA